MTSADLAILASAVAVIVGAYATYRNSVRKSEFDRLQDRVQDAEDRLADTEKRLADAEKRASDNEHRALEYREDVIKLGEQIEKERKESARRLAIVAQDSINKINRVVFVLETVIKDFEQATGKLPDVDLEALKRLVVIDHVTGPLGPIDVNAVNRFSQ